MTAPHETQGDYEMVVGLEVHVQLKTRSKAFCGCSADFGAPPNTNTCPVCLGLPGSLPVLNGEAVRLAVTAALALECDVQLLSTFARKNYFYPDLPKGYQISQYDHPLATGGKLVLRDSNRGEPARDADRKTVHITRLHMEEDSGKSVHDRFDRRTAIDLNRAGVPLIEIVSEPDMRSATEAGEYLRRLKEVLSYTGVSDVSMEEGSLRVDANVSARRRGESKLGTKTEVKNLNSFSAVERALQREFLRQCAALDRGERIIQQTMLWDAATGAVRPSRTKEDSQDYRYFPDPDLPPLVLDQGYVDRARKTLPELPSDLRARFGKEFHIVPTDIDVITADRDLAIYFEGVARAHGDPKAAANWVTGEVLAALNEEGIPITKFRVRGPEVAALLDMIRDGKLSHSAAKRVFAEMRKRGGHPAVVATEMGVLQVTDDSQTTQWIDEVFTQMPSEAARYAAGEKKLAGVLVGAVMRKSGGRADPRKVNELIAKRAP